MLSSPLLTLISQVSSKFIKIQRFQFDDWFLLGTMVSEPTSTDSRQTLRAFKVFGIGQTVANSQAVGFGLGTPEAQLSSAGLEGVEKVSEEIPLLLPTDTNHDLRLSTRPKCSSYPAWLFPKSQLRSLSDGYPLSRAFAIQHMPYLPSAEHGWSLAC